MLDGTRDPYAEFLASKTAGATPRGIEISDAQLNPALKPFQRDIVRWALRRGRSALFEGTGLGKTLQQLVWADIVADHESTPVLILAPLAVAEQTIREAAKFGIHGAHYAADQSAVRDRIAITNYDRLDKFDSAAFGGVVLDESSIIKSHDSKTRADLIERFGATMFKLCCTATPAPNDYTELGNHAEFLGVMRAQEMLAMYFVHEGAIRAGGASTPEWRLKGHAEKDFWSWVASWSVLIRDPSDLGYDEPGYVLPPLNKIQVTVPVEYKPTGGMLFPTEANTLSERIAARRDSISGRVGAVLDIIKAQPDRPWLIWCGLNDEGSALSAGLSDALEVGGSDDREIKAARLLGFTEGTPRILVTKPSIAGFGMNWQHCADMVFVGLNDSFEHLFQAIRRCWRFGQTKPVNVYLVASELEGAVVANLARKEADFDAMCAAMAGHMRDLSINEVRGAGSRRQQEIASKKMEIPTWLT